MGVTVAYEYVPLVFTLPDGQRVLVALSLPAGVRPGFASIAVQHETALGPRWGPPIAPDPE